MLTVTPEMGKTRIKIIKAETIIDETTKNTFEYDPKSGTVSNIDLYIVRTEYKLPQT